MPNDVLERVTTFTRGDYTFPVVDRGPLDGPSILLLHGFPQDSRSWDLVTPVLNACGYRTFVPDLRGAAVSAAPRFRWQYRMSELVKDVVALIDQVGAGRVHLVGHDWGAGLGWAVAATHPERLHSYTAVSVPHPRAFLRSFFCSGQGLHSWYMYLFQLPVIPELLFRTRLCRGPLARWIGYQEPFVSRDYARMSDWKTARGGLHWYRALPFLNPKTLRSVSTPTLMVWSDRDAAVGRKAVELCERYVDAPFRLHVFPGVSHWIPEMKPEALADLVANFLRQPFGENAGISR